MRDRDHVKFVVFHFVKNGKRKSGEKKATKSGSAVQQGPRSWIRLDCNEPKGDFVEKVLSESGATFLVPDDGFVQLGCRPRVKANLHRLECAEAGRDPSADRFPVFHYGRSTIDLCKSSLYFGEPGFFDTFVCGAFQAQDQFVGDCRPLILWQLKRLRENLVG